MAVDLSSNADMEKLDNLGETVEKALNEEQDYGGKNGTKSNHEKGHCNLSVSAELYQRLAIIAESANIRIEELIDKAVEFYVSKSGEDQSAG